MSRSRRTLKLYIWKNVLTDYTDGVIFALAHDSEEARQLVVKTAEATSESWAVSTLQSNMGTTPEEHDAPYAFWVWGGG